MTTALSPSPATRKPGGSSWPGTLVERALRELAADYRRPAGPALLALALAIGNLFAYKTAHDGGLASAGGVLLGLGAILPVAVIRRYPVPAIATVLAANSVFILIGRLDWRVFAMAGWLIALAACPVLLRRSLAVAALIFAEAVVLAAAVLSATWLAGVPQGVLAPGFTPWDATIAEAVGALAAWGAGEMVRANRQAAADRAAVAEQVRALSERELVRKERAAIARELHDVVAHHVSMIAVKAGTAQYTVGKMPAPCQDAFEEIAQQARTALTELRVVLGVLRAADKSVEAAPQPCLADLPDLLGRARAAGTSAGLTITGGRRPLSGSAELCGFRIVQEAVTNAGRHAPGSRVQVLLRYGPDALQITVSNGAAAAGAGARGGPAGASVARVQAGSGFGLVGLRERVTLLGGSFAAGPAASGGFAVRAELPGLTCAGPGGVLRLLVADDQAVVRLGFAALLDSQPDMAVVGSAENGQHAVSLAAELSPDVVLMDIRMPVLNGIEATRQVTALREPPRVLVLTTFDLDDYVYDALRAGASGFLLKDATPEEILTAVRVVGAGEALIAPAITARLIAEFAARTRLVPPPELADLSPREHEVLLLVAAGMSNGEIAGRLCVAEQTVKSHVSAVLFKLGLRDRVQAVILAYESGLVVPGTGAAG